MIAPLNLALRVIAVAVLLLGASASITEAQEATPAPVACDVAPRPVSFIAELLERPVPEATPTPLTGVPEGSDDVPPETRAAVTEVIAMVTACVNQGELLRAFALFDDAYLRHVIDPAGLMSDSVAREIGQSFATPVAVGETELTTVEEVLLVRALADGSVAIVFRTRGGAGNDQDHTQVDLFIMRELDGDWLIVDGLTDLDPESLPAPAG